MIKRNVIGVKVLAIALAHVRTSVGYRYVDLVVFLIDLRLEPQLPEQDQNAHRGRAKADAASQDPDESIQIVVLTREDCRVAVLIAIDYLADYVNEDQKKARDKEENDG